jgi:hypothetical protein
MAGLGLLFGGILTGLCSTPFAGQGVFPVEGLILGLCCLWCFGFGEADEATALQVGDRGPPALAIGSLSVLLFLLLGNIGAQPVLWIGAELRPFELVVAGLFGYLWHRSLFLPESFFYHLTRKHLRCLLLTGAGASLAGLFGGALADLGRFMILVIGPVPFMLAGIKGQRMAQILGVALSMALAFLSLSHAFHMRENRSVLEQLQTSAVEMALHYSELHEPVHQAMESQAYEEPEVRYGELMDTLREDVGALMESSRRLARPDLHPSLHLFSNALTSHRRWSLDLFEAISGRDEGLADWESRARSSHQEARLAYARGDSSLAALQKDLLTGYRYVGADTEQLAGLVLTLLVALSLLGWALLRSETRDREAVKFLELEPYDGSTKHDSEHDLAMSPNEPQEVGVHDR